MSNVADGAVTFQQTLSKAALQGRDRRPTVPMQHAAEFPDETGQYDDLQSEISQPRVQSDLRVHHRNAKPQIVVELSQSRYSD